MRFFWPLMMLLLLLNFSASAVAEKGKAGYSKAMTHGELAKKICFISGLAESLKPPITPAVAIDALNQKGWSPLNGWRLNAYATREDFYIVIAKYLHLKIEGPLDQPQNYYRALMAEGFVVAEGSEIIESMDPAPPHLSKESLVELSHVVLSVKGDVEFRKNLNGEWQKLNSYEQIVEGMEIRTSDQGEVSVVYAPGCSQQIFGGSLVRVLKLFSGPGTDVPVNLMIEIDGGKTFTFVKPQPANSRILVKNKWGTLEIDAREGCDFESVASNGESLTLNRTEMDLALGWKELAQIQESGFRCTSFRGNATGRHSGGENLSLKPGESLLFLLNGMRLGPADSFDYGRLANLLKGLEKRSEEYLLTESEIRAFLSGIGSGGIAEIFVTPIGK